MFRLVAFTQEVDGFQRRYEQLFALNRSARREAIVAAAAVLLRKLFAEVVQQHFTSADCGLGIGSRLQQQLFTDLLFDDGLALQELLQLLKVFVGVESQASALATVTSGTPRLLVIALETFGNVVMDHIAYVGLVDTHTEGNGGHNDVSLFHQEGVLIPRSRLRVHACMVRQSLDTVGAENVGELLHPFSAEAVDDARLALVGFDVFDDLAIYVLTLRPHLVVEVGAVEGGLEDRGVQHAEILLNVVLHLRRGRSRQGDEGMLADLVDDGSYATVFRSEVVPPLRDTVRLVDGVERDLHLTQKLDVLLFRQ